MPNSKIKEGTMISFYDNYSDFEASKCTDSIVIKLSREELLAKLGIFVSGKLSMQYVFIALEPVKIIDGK